MKHNNSPNTKCQIPKKVKLEAMTIHLNHTNPSIEFSYKILTLQIPLIQIWAIFVEKRRCIVFRTQCVDGVGTFRKLFTSIHICHGSGQNGQIELLFRNYLHLRFSIYNTPPKNRVFKGESFHNSIRGQYFLRFLKDPDQLANEEAVCSDDHYFHNQSLLHYFLPLSPY